MITPSSTYAIVSRICSLTTTCLLLGVMWTRPCVGQSEAYGRALGLLRDGKLADASEVCESGLQRMPENYQLAYLHGQILLRQLQQLEKSHEDSLRVKPLMRRAKMNLLHAETTSPVPLDAGLDHALGSILLREGKLTGAVERFSVAISKAPAKSVFYRLRGHTLMRLEKFTEAQQDLSKAVRLEPDNHANQTYLAEALFNGGKTEAARNALQIYYADLRQRPDDGRHSHILFLIYEYALAANDLPAARMALEAGLEITPGDPRLQLELGVLLYRLGEFEASTGFLDALLSADELEQPALLRAKAHRQRGFIAQQQGDHRLARGHLEQALQLMPEDAASLQSLGVTLRHLGEYNLAHDVTKRLQAIRHAASSEPR